MAEPQGPQRDEESLLPHRAAPEEAPGAPADPLDLQGQRIGHYRLKEHLCQGGMGEVYVAEHVHLGRSVAIKIPRTDGGDAFFNQQQLLAEARHLARVAHVNVVGVYDLGYGPEGLAYLVLEHLQGTSLDNVLARTPFLGLSEVIHLVREVARGLGACHRAGILVCDVKPENVMIVGGPLIGLAPQGTVWTKLIDLGAALTLPVEAEGPLGLRRSHRVGTPAYASPELIQGRALDLASDVYSLGVLLYELVAGCFPFPAQNDAEHLRMAVEASPTPLSAHREGVPKGGPLESFVATCLAKDPRTRPKDMVAFLDGLDRAASEASIGRSGDEALCGDLQPNLGQPRPQISTVQMDREGVEPRPGGAS
jgi:serine/threonine-protein kinase